MIEKTKYRKNTIKKRMSEYRRHKKSDSESNC